MKTPGNIFQIALISTTEMVWAAQMYVNPSLFNEIHSAPFAVPLSLCLLPAVGYPASNAHRYKVYAKGNLLNLGGRNLCPSLGYPDSLGCDFLNASHLFPSDLL